MLEEKLSDLEGKSIGIIYSKEARNIKSQRSLGHYKALQHTYNRVQEKERKNNSENIFEEIMAENSSICLKK